MESVYLETTFISYLIARPSRDVIVAGHQQTTQDWWENRRSEFECAACAGMKGENAGVTENKGTAGMSPIDELGLLGNAVG